MLIPVMDIAGVDGSDEEDNFLLLLIPTLGVTLVIVEEPACCIVNPKVGGLC